jgi:hypothetical protein
VNRAAWQSTRDAVYWVAALQPGAGAAREENPMSGQLQGIIPPMTTPFDVPGTRRSSRAAGGQPRAPTPAASPARQRAIRAALEGLSTARAAE